MPPVVRAVPISSREEALALLEDIRKYPNQDEKDEFAAAFNGTTEDWYYQVIEGKDYLIAVTDGGDIDAGHALYKDSEMPFFKWFSERVQQLSGVNLRSNPRGADSEYLGRLDQ